MRLSASRCHFRQCPLEIRSASAERAGVRGEVGEKGDRGEVTVVRRRGELGGGRRGEDGGIII